MTSTVFVEYATRCGSTQEVTEAIAKTLRDAGHTVDFQRLRDAHTVAGYSAVVIEAPLFMFNWHRDALRFLSRNRKALLERPVAIFALGPVHDPHDEEEWRDSWDQLNKALAKISWLKPVSVEMFAGKYDPARLGFLFKNVCRQRTNQRFA